MISETILGPGKIRIPVDTGTRAVRNCRAEETCRDDSTKTVCALVLLRISCLGPGTIHHKLQSYQSHDIRSHSWSWQDTNTSRCRYLQLQNEIVGPKRLVVMILPRRTFALSSYFESPVLDLARYIIIKNYLCLGPGTIHHKELVVPIII
jgi:hypothetical protein